MCQRTFSDPLKLYGTSFKNRILLGTACYPSTQSLIDSITAASPAMVTIALRRQIAGGKSYVGLFESLKSQQCLLLPNTAGCRSVDEVYATAQMAREIFETDWIKLELIGDEYTLHPDTFHLTTAANRLIKDGFKVLPYCTEDLIIAQRLLDAGCQALMPWAAPIGTGRGVINPYGLRILRERLPKVPLIVDAGLGLPSHVCQVFEWGCDGILLNTAISQADDPPMMAKSFSLAAISGRIGYLAGLMPKRNLATASTTVVGIPFWQQTQTDGK